MDHHSAGDADILGLVWIVDKSCDFVVLLGRNADGEVVDTITRGTQRGMLGPNDVCQNWAQYEELELDTKMVVTRVTAAMSIVLGAVCIFFLFVWLKWSRRWIKCLVVVCSVSISVFQALTHLMVKSDLCEGQDPITSVNEAGQTIVYDECSNSTPTYNITFATIALWLAVAVLAFLLPTSLNSHHTRNLHFDLQHIDDDAKKNTEKSEDNDAV